MQINLKLWPVLEVFAFARLALKQLIISTRYKVCNWVRIHEVSLGSSFMNSLAWFSPDAARPDSQARFCAQNHEQQVKFTSFCTALCVRVPRAGVFGPCTHRQGPVGALG